jgi:hypothetical protein
VAAFTEQTIQPGSHQFIDLVNLAYHREIAARLRVTPDGILARARSNLKRWLANYEPGSAEARCFEEWMHLLETRTVLELIAIITADTEEGQRLRQSTPFTGILSSQTRKEIVKRCEERAVA